MSTGGGWRHTRAIWRRRRTSCGCGRCAATSSGPSGAAPPPPPPLPPGPPPHSVRRGNRRCWEFRSTPCWSRWFCHQWPSIARCSAWCWRWTICCNQCATRPFNDSTLCTGWGRLDVASKQNGKQERRARGTEMHQLTLLRGRSRIPYLDEAVHATWCGESTRSKINLGTGRAINKPNIGTAKWTGRAGSASRATHRTMTWIVYICCWDGATVYRWSGLFEKGVTER
mmetsp:Transcript_9632/g.19973  ORF Transcript_9632/g.19973 Transcript_9632/m.19973 type:complete len:227 (+) Transcript_9632:289-969(+)